MFRLREREQARERIRSNETLDVDTT